MSGAIEEALQQIQTAVAEGAHLSDVHYVSGVIHWQLGLRDETLDALETAIDLGYPPKLIAGEPHFAGLAGNDRFRQLVGEQ